MPGTTQVIHERWGQVCARLTKGQMIRWGEGRWSWWVESFAEKGSRVKRGNSWKGWDQSLFFKWAITQHLFTDRNVSIERGDWWCCKKVASCRCDVFKPVSGNGIGPWNRRVDDPHVKTRKKEAEHKEQVHWSCRFRCLGGQMFFSNLSPSFHLFSYG